jgi:hypothetical protein
LLDVYHPGLLNGRSTALDDSADLELVRRDVRDDDVLWLAYMKYNDDEQIRALLSELGYENLLHQYYAPAFAALYLDLWAKPGHEIGRAVSLDFDAGSGAASARAGIWQLTPGRASVSLDPAGQSVFRLVTTDSGPAYAGITLPAQTGALYTTSFEARSQLQSGEALSFLICLSTAGSFSQIAPGPGGLSVPNDGAWHSVRIAALCPQNTDKIKVDLRNWGVGTVDYRRVTLFEQVSVGGSASRSD